MFAVLVLLLLVQRLLTASLQLLQLQVLLQPLALMKRLQSPFPGRRRHCTHSTGGSGC